MAIGRNCFLGFGVAQPTGAEHPIDPLIERIGLQLLDPPDLRNDKICNALKTGAGLRFDASLEDIQLFYGGIHLIELSKEAGVGNGAEVYGGENGQECLSGRSALLRSMRIYWSSKRRRIMVIVLEASRTNCQEYRHNHQKPGLQRKQ